jgi:S1-C subfamily serine protease
MRRFQAFLLSVGLVAAPAGAVAQPSEGIRPSDTSPVEKIDSSTNKPRLGVYVMSISPELRRFFGSPDSSGVLVAKVEPGSAAARAGILVGDVLMNVRDTKVDDAEDVVAALNTTADHVKVRLLREKKPLELQVKLGSTTQSTLELAPLRWLHDLFERSGTPSST